jgi:uncharacterized protein (TIRG00374 family)
VAVRVNCTHAEEVRQTLVLNRTGVIGLACGLPLSALFLWLALRGTDLDEVGSALSDANVGLVVLAVGVFSLLYAPQAERWRRIAATDVGLPRFVEMVLGSVACNNVLPARIGDLLRARWLSKAADVSSGRALASVVLDRSCDIIVLFAFLVATLPEVAGAGWSRRLTFGALVLVVALALGLVFARMYVRRRPRARLSSRSTLRRVVRDVLDGLAEPMGRMRLAVALVLSTLAWCAFATAAMLVGRAVGVDLGVVDALFVTAVINLGVAIPSSPGFVGTYQWLGIASLGLAGVDRSPALALVILLQACWYVPTTIVGGGLLVRRGYRVAVSSALLRRSGTEQAS